jgi:hypothetical protein
MRKTLLFAGLSLMILLGGCADHPNEKEEVMGYRPVYGTNEDLIVKILPAQDLCNPGKIYVYGSYLLVNELNKGVHIINNANPGEPRNLSFLKVTGSADMAVREGFLYVDQYADIIIFDITNPYEAKMVHKVPRAVESKELYYYPTQTGVSFECADPKKGAVIGWEQALLVNPKCYR